jgi:hypothetical protein
MFRYEALFHRTCAFANKILSRIQGEIMSRILRPLDLEPEISIASLPIPLHSLADPQTLNVRYAATSHARFSAQSLLAKLPASCHATVLGFSSPSSSSSPHCPSSSPHCQSSSPGDPLPPRDAGARPPHPPPRPGGDSPRRRALPGGPRHH